MGKVMTINDFPLYARMVADLLTSEGGHEVRVGISPLIAGEILEFAPDVLVITIVRKLETIGHGAMHDFYTEVDGARSFREITRLNELKGVPIVIAAIAVRENEVPRDLNYTAFVQVPQEMDLLVAAVNKLIEAAARGDRWLDS